MRSVNVYFRQPRRPVVPVAEPAPKSPSPKPIFSMLFSRSAGFLAIGLSLLLLLFLDSTSMRYDAQAETIKRQQCRSALELARSWPATAQAVRPALPASAAASELISAAIKTCKLEWLKDPQARAHNEQASGHRGTLTEAEPAPRAGLDTLGFFHDPDREGRMLLTFARAVAYSLALGGLALMALQIALWLAPHNPALAPFLRWWRDIVKPSEISQGVASAAAPMMGSVLLPLLGAAPLFVGVTLAVVPSLEGGALSLPIKVQPIGGDSADVQLNLRPVATPASAPVQTGAAEGRSKPEPVQVKLALHCPGADAQASGVEFAGYADRLDAWAWSVTQGMGLVERNTYEVQQTLDKIRRRFEFTDQDIEGARTELGQRIEWGTSPPVPGMRSPQARP